MNRISTSTTLLVCHDFHCWRSKTKLTSAAHSLTASISLPRSLSFHRSRFRQKKQTKCRRDDRIAFQAKTNFVFLYFFFLHFILSSIRTQKYGFKAKEGKKWTISMINDIFLLFFPFVDCRAKRRENEEKICRVKRKTKIFFLFCYIFWNRFSTISLGFSPILHVQFLSNDKCLKWKCVVDRFFLLNKCWIEMVNIKHFPHCFSFSFLFGIDECIFRQNIIGTNATDILIWFFFSF